MHLIESTATGTLAITKIAADSQIKSNEVTVVFSRRSDTPENIENLFSENVCLIEQCMHPKTLLFSFFSLRKIIKTISPEIIHCHSSFAGFLGRMSSIGLKVKIFYSPHCISFMRKDIGIAKRLIFGLFEWVACVKKSTYIACSESERKAIKKVLPFVDVRLLENAVDLSDFSGNKKTSENHQDNTLRVITVGGIRSQKGPEEYAEIANKFRDGNVKFIWVGDGDEVHKKILLDAGVIITGWLPRFGVLNELQEANVYLSTARWEGMPVSVIEAFAANIPVVARCCAGNKDIIDHGKTGFLFEKTEECIQLIENYSSQKKIFNYPGQQCA